MEAMLMMARTRRTYPFGGTCDWRYEAVDKTEPAVVRFPKLHWRTNMITDHARRLEGGGAAPAIDSVARLARALGTTSHDPLPETVPPDTLAGLREHARRLFDALLVVADRETLLMLNALLARLVETAERRMS
jgi:hypothetical protein